jgi:putative redox protein
MDYLLDKNIEGEIGTQKYLCTIFWRNGQLLMDEPESLGGNDLGPDPFSTFLASLAGCTLSTLRMYIDRKGWNIPEIKISLNLYQDSSRKGEQAKQTNEELETTISRTVSFSGNVSDEQKERLLVIADKCPISKLLKGTITINTIL